MNPQLPRMPSIPVLPERISNKKVNVPDRPKTKAFKASAGYQPNILPTFLKTENEGRAKTSTAKSSSGIGFQPNLPPAFQDVQKVVKIRYPLTLIFI